MSMSIKITKDGDGNFSVARCDGGTYGRWVHWLPFEGDPPFRCFIKAVEAARRERLVELERKCEYGGEDVEMDIEG